MQGNLIIREKCNEERTYLLCLLHVYANVPNKELNFVVGICSFSHFVAEWTNFVPIFSFSFIFVLHVLGF
jgi:hypothetical protein